MPRQDYALLVLPAFNAIYAEAAPRLCSAELQAFNVQALDGRIADIAVEALGGVPYVCFSAEELSAVDVALISNLSSIYALFRRSGDALHPIELKPADLFPGDLITIQRYRGKTNPYLTKLLLNLTLLAACQGSHPFASRRKVLDPLCGRGTTLNQALMYGFDAYGVDVDEKDFEAYRAFISRWLKDKRLKHALKSGAIRRPGQRPMHLLEIELGATKDQFKAGETIRIEYLNADTSGLGARYRKAGFDALVTDLPYGVQHGSHAPGAAPSRRPLELLEAALPTWISVLRPGGALGLAWNTKVASRDRLLDLVAGFSELKVLDGEPYRQFRHGVDQAIVRDLLIACRAS